MESRYLVATLALAATFGIFQHEFRTGHLAALRDPQGTVACLKSSGSALASRVLCKVESKLRPDHPEEAQMLAEMNLPFAQEQAMDNERVAQEATIMALRAQQDALQVSGRAMQASQHAMQKAAKHQAAKAAAYGPISVRVNLSNDLQRRIDLQNAEIQRRVDLQTADIQRRVALQTADLQRRLAAQTLRINMESAKFARASARAQAYPVVVKTVTGVSPESNCEISERAREAVRRQVHDVVRTVEVNFASN